MNAQNRFPSIEPGILPIFRFFVTVQLALNGWEWWRSGRTSFRLLSENFPRLATWLVDRQISSLFYLAWSVLLLVLLLFLLLPPFPRWLKGAYFPLALILQVTILIVQSDVVAFARLSDTTIDAGARTWQLFVFLSVPILLASWQYAFRTVLGLIFFSGGLDLIVILVLAGAFAVRPGPMFLGLLARTGLYGVIGYTVTRLMREQRQLRRSLQTANQQLAHYVSTLDALAAARERNRLARELHDTLAHTLSGLVIQLESINILWVQDPQKAQQELQASTTQARAGLNETRRAIKSLRAAPLEEMGLLTALRQAAQEASQRGGFQVAVRLPETLPPFPPEVENHLYRVAVEAFENIVRHAHARQVTVALRVSAQALGLEITDDGQGFDPKAVDGAAHFGLLGLRERAALQGATFDVESQPGKGTKITYQLEVSHDSHSAVR
jgi:signal transduction histidine kinase